jgi:hypothetical protein
VIVLDENVFESQRTRLRRWRIRPIQIGRDLPRKGIGDDEIITLLQSLRRRTFVSRDRDFFQRPTPRHTVRRVRGGTSCSKN